MSDHDLLDQYADEHLAVIEEARRLVASVRNTPEAKRKKQASAAASKARDLGATYDQGHLIYHGEQIVSDLIKANEYQMAKVHEMVLLLAEYRVFIGEVAPHIDAASVPEHLRSVVQRMQSEEAA